MLFKTLRLDSRFYLGAILFLTIFVFFQPMRQSEFLNWDDDLYVTNNKAIQSESGLYFIWVENQMPNPYPITFSVLWIQLQLFGMEPVPFHFVNLLLHLGNLVLCWIFFGKFCVSNPVRFGIVFFYALHPVQVESVMWVSEVKNLLSASFYWLSLFAFFRYFEGGTKRWVAYSTGLLMFTISLAAKSMTVTLPVTLVLWALVFHQKQFWRHVLAFIPLWFISIFFGIMSIYNEARFYMERHQSTLDRTLLERLQHVTEAILFYLSKFFWPVSLGAVYPQHPLVLTDAISFLVMGLLFLFLAGCFFLLFFRPEFPRLILFGIFNYGIVAGPILGFFSTTYLPLSLVSDRYNYHPLPFFLLALFLLLEKYLPKNKTFRRVMILLLCPVLLLMLVQTHRHAFVWSNPIQLWQETSRINPKEAEVRYNVAHSFLQKNDMKQVEEAFLETLRLDPQHYPARIHYAATLVKQNRLEEALFHFSQSLRYSKRPWKDHYHIALISAKLKRNDQAIEHYEKMFKTMDPHDEVQKKLREDQIYFKIGLLYWQKKQREDAKKYFEKALVGQRANEAKIRLGEYWLKEDPTQAEKYFFQAIEEFQDNPKQQAEIWITLKQMYQGQKEDQKAFQAIKTAFEISPEHPIAQKEMLMLLLNPKWPDFFNPQQALQILREKATHPTHPLFFWYPKTLILFGEFPEALQKAKHYLQNNQVSKIQVQEIQKQYGQYRCGIVSSEQ